jgi:hypothetical protein
VEGFQPRSRIKSGRHDVPVIFMAFPVVSFFSLHDFQTQCVTLIEVCRAPGAVWLPWDWTELDLESLDMWCRMAGVHIQSLGDGDPTRWAKSNWWIVGLSSPQPSSLVANDCRTKTLIASELCNPWQFQHLVTDFLRTVVLDDLGIHRSRCPFGLWRWNWETE